MEWQAKRRKMILRAYKEAKKHNRAWIVVSHGLDLATLDSNAVISEQARYTLCCQAVVYPDGTYHAGGRRHSIDLARY